MTPPAACFAQALQALSHIYNRPMFLGKSGFYVDAVTKKRVDPPVDPAMPRVTFEMIFDAVEVALPAIRKKILIADVKKYLAAQDLLQRSPSKPARKRMLFPARKFGKPKKPRKIKDKTKKARRLVHQSG